MKEYLHLIFIPIELNINICSYLTNKDLNNLSKNMQVILFYY
jgi:hypothetical protein